MLEIICNIALKPKIFYIKDNHHSNIIDQSYSSEAILDQLTKSLLTQKIEFINIATKKKKKDDKNSICDNFTINNVLNFFNQKNEYLNINQSDKTQNKNTQKKKIEKNNNLLLDNNHFFKQIKIDKINNNQKKNHILDAKLLSNQLKKNKNSYNQKNELNNEDIKNNYTFVKCHDHDDHKKMNFYKNSQENIKFITKQNNMTFLKDVKSNKNNLFLSKNINKIDNVLRNENCLKDIYAKKNTRSNVKPLFFSNSDNSIEWRKLVSRRILLSISHKENHAEIYLKPENLGTIYIKIHMKDEKASFNFISSHNEVRIFLHNYIPFLKDGLKKKGIKLSSVNISNSVKNSEFKNTQNTVYLEKLAKSFNTNQKKMEQLRYAFVDLYI